MSARILDHFVPADVLDDYDGPRLFTVRDDHGQTLLAYLYNDEETAEGAEYLVVPFDDDGITALRAGRMTILEALSQRWLWRAVGHLGGTAKLTPTRLSAFDESMLPGHNSVLSLEHVPLLSVRMMGPGISGDSVPVSVARHAIEAAEGAIKMTSEFVAETHIRGASILQPLSDLRIQRVGFGSFEVALRSELPPPVHLGDGLDPMRQVRRMLRGAVSAAATRPSDLDLDQVFGDKEAGEVAFEAIFELTPPRSGPMDTVEIAGSLVGGPRSQRLTREARGYVKRFTRPPGEEIVEAIGVVDDPGYDRKSFSVVRQSGERIVFSYEDEETFELVAEAFKKRTVCKATGRKKPKMRRAKLVNVETVQEQK
ncbi:MAG TPA: hypothetical protein PLW65_05000 [Pseudomonadota bacterium]|nr:hypothetical protein [Pseudomonadota bacterium]